MSKNETIKRKLTDENRQFNDEQTCYQYSTISFNGTSFCLICRPANHSALCKNLTADNSTKQNMQPIITN